MTHISIETAALKEGLKRLKGIIPSKPVVPILSYCHFQCDGDKIYLTATDLEQTAQVCLYESQFSEDISFCVELAPLLYLISNSEKSETEIKVYDEKVVVLTDAGEYSFPIPVGEDFPEIPNFEGADEYFTCMPSKFESGLAHVIHAVGTDELRPAMMHVQLKTTIDGCGTFYATNGYVLSKYWDNSLAIREDEVTVYTENNFIKTLWSVSAAKNLTKFLKGTPIQVKQDNRRVFIIQGDDWYAFQQTEAAFPDIDSIHIPAPVMTGTFDLPALMEILGRMKVAIDGSTNHIRFTVNKNQGMYIVAQNEINDRSGKEYIPMIVDNEDGPIRPPSLIDEEIVAGEDSMTLAVNLALFSDILAALHYKERVRMLFAAPNRTLSIVSVNTDDEEACEKHLIMPINLG